MCFFINHTYIEFKGGGAKDMSFTLYSFQCLNDKEIVYIFRCKQNSVQTFWREEASFYDIQIFLNIM